LRYCVSAKVQEQRQRKEISLAVAFPTTLTIRDAATLLSRFRFLFVAAFATSASVAGGQAVVDSVPALDSTWAHSSAIHDTVFARAILAEDIVITATNGSLKSREDEIRDVRP